MQRLEIEFQSRVDTVGDRLDMGAGQVWKKCENEFLQCLLFNM